MTDTHDDHEHTHTRRQVLAGIGALASAPLTIAPSSRPSTFSGWSAPDEAYPHSDDRFRWLVSLDDDGLDALESWIDGGDGRRLERGHEDSATASIVADPADIGVRNRDQLLSASGLVSEDWIEYVELDLERSLADPVSPADESAWNAPSTWSLEGLALSLSSGTLDAETVAFTEDMTETTIRESREVTRALEADAGTLPDTSSITAAVIDTGVNPGPTFEDDDGETRLLETSKDFTTSGEPTGYDAAEDGDGHGTWVASAIASGSDDDRYRGYLPDARILALKALGDDGGGSTSDIESAIRYAADEGADVICMSLGSPVHSMALEDALEYAVDGGAIPVAAVGNDRQLTRYVATPASSEHAIGVASVTVDDADDALSAYYSNVGPHNGVTDDSAGATAGAQPTVAAPGCETTAEVTTTRGSTRLETLTGTSMAAPKVAGAIGLLLAADGPMDFDEVVDRLERTARPVPNAAVEEVGSGMIDVAALLADDEPEETQADVMTDEAYTRGVAYDQLSSWTGRRVVRWIS